MAQILSMCPFIPTFVLVFPSAFLLLSFFLIFEVLLFHSAFLMFEVLFFHIAVPDTYLPTIPDSPELLRKSASNYGITVLRRGVKLLRKLWITEI